MVEVAFVQYREVVEAASVQYRGGGGCFLVPTTG